MVRESGSFFLIRFRKIGKQGLFRAICLQEFSRASRRASQGRAGSRKVVQGRAGSCRVVQGSCKGRAGVVQGRAGPCKPEISFNFCVVGVVQGRARSCAAAATIGSCRCLQVATTSRISTRNLMSRRLWHDFCIGSGHFAQNAKCHQDLRKNIAFELKCSDRACISEINHKIIKNHRNMGKTF